MIASIYKTRQIGSGLRHHPDRYRVYGTIQHEMCDYWIIDDLVECQTYHVLVSLRPSWEKYVEAN